MKSTVKNCLKFQFEIEKNSRLFFIYFFRLYNTILLTFTSESEFKIILFEYSSFLSFLNNMFVFFVRRSFLISLLDSASGGGSRASWDDGVGRVSFFHKIVRCSQRIDLRERVVRFVEALFYQILLHVRFQYDHTCWHLKNYK